MTGLLIVLGKLVNGYTRLLKPWRVTANSWRGPVYLPAFG